jgi:hypothetical protein
MLKGAIYFFAFSIFLFGCSTKISYPPLPAPPPSQPVPTPDIPISDTSLSEGDVEMVGKQEVSPVVEDEEKIVLLSPPLPPSKPEAAVESLPLPDITITNLFLNPKRGLAVTIANIGNGPLPIGIGNLRILVDGQLKESFSLASLSDQSFLPPKGSITFTTSLTVFGCHEIHAHVDTGHEIRELNKENNHFKKTLEGLPIGPDIVVKDLELTEDLELCIILSNAGEVDLRKGITFRTRIFVNDRKISEFDHFIPEVLKANFGNRYIIDPPYQVGIAGISKVKVSISPKLSSDDIRLENNVLERTFIIFPFKIGPQGREEFSFSFSAPRPQGEGQTEKVKTGARWEGSSSSLMLSFKKSGNINGMPTLSGKSPLKVEFPIPFEEVQKESVWSIFVTNLVDKKVEGHLIIQHP